MGRRHLYDASENIQRTQKTQAYSIRIILRNRSKIRRIV
jgi:hypothetical protein